MFSKTELTIFDWYIFWMLMAIPVVNIIILLMILFSSETNPTLQSMIWAQVVLAILITILFMTVFQPYVSDLINYIQNIYPINQIF